MSFQARHRSLVSSSSSSQWLPVKPIRAYFFNEKIVGLDHQLFIHFHTRKKGRLRISHVETGKFSLRCRLSDLGKQSSSFCKLRRIGYLKTLASAGDGVTVNGSSQARTSSDAEEMRYQLNQSLQDEEYNTGLVQLLHDAARVFELEIKEQSSLSKITWFSTAWLGVDRNAWVKALSYQALESVEEALLQLEELLQELHVTSSSSGKEHLKAACSDLERIRTLKKEAEFLEASFRAKAASLQRGDVNGTRTDW